VHGGSVDVGLAPPGSGPRTPDVEGSGTPASGAPDPPRPARPGRRSACHRAPKRWRPGCSCPMLT